MSAIRSQFGTSADRPGKAASESITSSMAFICVGVSLSLASNVDVAELFRAPKQ